MTIRAHLERANRLFEKEDGLFEDLLDKIIDYKKKRNCFIVYGAGKYGKDAVRYYKRNIPDINIVNVAISNEVDNPFTVEGIEVKRINCLKEYSNEAMVLIMSVVPDYIVQMKNTLKELGFMYHTDLFEK